MANEKRSPEFEFYSEQWVSVRVPSCHREIESMFEDMIHRAWGRTVWRPAVDLLETPEGFVIRVDLPGIDPEDLTVSVEDQCMLIEGERKDVDVPGPMRVRINERPKGRFSRLIQFAVRIDPESVTKQLAKGVLTLTVRRFRQGASL